MAAGIVATSPPPTPQGATASSHWKQPRSYCPPGYYLETSALKKALPWDLVFLGHTCADPDPRQN